tara:strand:- start:338 stop:1135 length:798 start_codon:yes stop_codon:yes gene_type:complete
VNSFSKKNAREKNKLEKRLKRQIGKAIFDFDMIADGDMLMIAISGGKDSFAMLDLLIAIRTYAPINFELIAVNLDQKQPGFPQNVLPNYLKDRKIPFKILEQDTYSVVKKIIPEGKTMCGLCSRLRRGALYKAAEHLGANKIALGHHQDDILETFFLNLFYGGQIKTMPPKLLSDDKKHVVIRPLTYCKEEDLGEYARLHKFPIIPCNLCGSQTHLQRYKIKEMLANWEKSHPGRKETIFSSLQTIVPSHLLDSEAFNFSDLKKK